MRNRQKRVGVVDFSVRDVDDANLEVNKLVSALDDFKGHNSSGCRKMDCLLDTFVKIEKFTSSKGFN